MNIDIDKLNNIARNFNDKERDRRSERRLNKYWWCASSAIANKILRRLRILNLSDEDFASMINIEESKVAEMLDGKTNFDLKTLVSIERAIDIHIIDQEVIPQTKPSKEETIKIEYKVYIPSGQDKVCCKNHIDEEFTSIGDSLGKSEKYIIYG